MTISSSQTKAFPIPGWLDKEAYPFSHGSLQLRLGAMHYIDEGQGKPILFVHGTPTWSFDYRHVIRALSSTYRCIAPDHLGFGLSDRPQSASYTPEEHAENLKEFVERLGLTDFTLVVHDYGGPIGLPLALEEKFGVNRVVILNSWMWSFEDDPDMVKKARIAGGSFGNFLYRWFNFSLRVITPSAYGDKKKLTKEIFQQYLAPFEKRADRGLVLHALAKALLGSSQHFQSLWERRSILERIPALIIWGMKDSAFQPKQLERWKQALPHAKVVTLAGAGHWPHEEEPEAVIEALRSFLA